jgi:hypothetical protein
MTVGERWRYPKASYEYSRVRVTSADGFLVDLHFPQEHAVDLNRGAGSMDAQSTKPVEAPLAPVGLA